MSKLTRKYPDFALWVSALDDACLENLNVSLFDLPDVCYRDAYNEGLTPEQAYQQFITEDWADFAPMNEYTQEYDTFSDADPGL